MQIADNIFREYDIRGTIGSELSEDFAYLLGRAYAEKAKEAGKDNIAIGFDCRPTSEPFARALAKGMNAEGISACLIGMGPTSQVYWSVFELGFGGGIQVTGSHNPPEMNGFKICIGNQGIFGEDILDLRSRMHKILDSNKSTSSTIGTTSEKVILPDYTNYIVNNCQSHMGNRKLKVVVDAGNGVGGMAGPEILRRLGCEVVELFCEPDGTFPNHHPDPSLPENLETLCEMVVAEKADLGIAWDGDADRIGLVDENGDIIFGDMIVLILARAILKEVPNATIIGDVKCSSLLFKDVNKHGGNAVMWKTGHSLIKNKLKELKAELAGEMSGHIFFGHRFYGYDCAIYCAARLVELLSNTNVKVSEILSDLPTTVSTPEMRLDCPDQIKFQIVEKAKSAFNEYKVDFTDGVRIDFDHGWGLVRASNTQPVLVTRFEAETEDQLEDYRKLVFHKLEEIKQQLLPN